MSKNISMDVWNVNKHKVKSHWKELREEEIDNIQGQRDRFVEIIQKRYLIPEEEAGRQFDDFKDECEVE